MGHRRRDRVVPLPMKNRLRVLRAERDWSQGELADRLEVSRQTVNALRTKSTIPAFHSRFASPRYSACGSRTSSNRNSITSSWRNVLSPISTHASGSPAFRTPHAGSPAARRSLSHPMPRPSRSFPIKARARMRLGRSGYRRKAATRDHHRGPRRSEPLLECERRAHRRGRSGWDRAASAPRAAP